MFVAAHQIVQAPDAKPVATAMFLHGILGSGRNLRTLATRLVEQLPRLRVVLVDLRCHGDSTGAPPPHTLQACAEDLRSLGQHLGALPAAVIGHSFGGKVALTYAHENTDDTLRQVWTLDTTPGARTPADPDELGVTHVVDLLQDVPLPLASRQALVEILTARGTSQALAQWMTTNVKPVSPPGPAGGLTWKFDLAGVRELLASYFATDLWPVLEHPPSGLELHVVRAGREPRWTPAILRRLQDLPPAVHLHSLDAGHWLHSEDPEGLLALLVPALRALT